MNAWQLDDTIRRYGIKTVVNLRGAFPDEQWYLDEIRVSKADLAEHLDFRLSAAHYLAPKSLDSIVTIVESAPKPVLVHCQGGADRTGLFCAAWKLKIDKSLPEDAAGQLSVLYGHIPYMYDKTEEMDRSFADYTRFVRSLK
ncbi:tyrosine-protein phosphatase [Chlorobaculum sp. MV4-Y]|uniref:phosphatase domain-containing putative toxin n=1 Tax=Chlorobaculum sp. MV4-Y TaxID=2976335 RepID=UPI0021AFCECE|nr:tyrosine-protein phosphatase [Chlorobaculum sp. MV4-Y]UWX57884.1 tyrosine-protein phosphatase [Chlorobaculum sp. MV4-Y]